MSPNVVNGYIYMLSENYHKNEELDFHDLEILGTFAWIKYNTAYSICSYKKSRNTSKMAYKNVNRRIKRLLVLRLIEEAHITPKNKRRINYYNLTEYGIYQLFLKGLDSIRRNEEKIHESVFEMADNTRNFLKNYSDSELFKCFVYPYFEKSTLIGIGAYVLWDLLDYLANCCKRIETEIPSFQIGHNFSAYEAKFCWNKIHGKGEEEEKNLRNFLKHKYNLEERAISRSDIIKDESDNSIRVTIPDSGTILIKLIEKNTKIIFTTAINIGLQRNEYEVQKIGSDQFVVEPSMHEVKLTDLIHSVKKEIEQLIYQFVCKLGASSGDSEKDYFSELLSKDNKFMTMVDYLFNNHKYFENGCAKLKYRS
jgi:hypothetical protein